jgi:hypothetical protein
MRKRLNTRSGLDDQPLAGMRPVTLPVVLNLRPPLTHQPCSAVGELSETKRRPRDLRPLCHVSIVTPEQVEFEIEPISIDHATLGFAHNALIDLRVNLMIKMCNIMYKSDNSNSLTTPSQAAICFQQR